MSQGVDARRLSDFDCVESNQGIFFTGHAFTGHARWQGSSRVMPWAQGHKKAHQCLFDFFGPPSRFECYLQKKTRENDDFGIATFKI
jgi:hypothetical protein